MEAEKKRGKHQKKLVPGPKKIPARAGWLKRPRLKRCVAARPLDRTRVMRIGDEAYSRNGLPYYPQNSGPIQWARGNYALSAPSPRAPGQLLGPILPLSEFNSVNCNCNLSLCGTFLHRLLPLLVNCGLLPTPEETYDLNLRAVTFRISVFRIPTSIFCTKELYNPGLLPSPRANVHLVQTDIVQNRDTRQLSLADPIFEKLLKDLNANEVIAQVPI